VNAIRAFEERDLEAVHELLADNGWRERLGSRDDLRDLIAASAIALVADEGGRVLGFVRALTDFRSNGYVSMLAVAADARRRGVGTALMRAAMGDDERITWVLRAGREGAAAFHASLGFEPSAVAMERRRRSDR
jgi:ribosomal protein S18 acetylase RimI-like enzyme